MRVKVFPDTSFLCSLYREQVFSPCADAWMKSCQGPIPVSSFTLLEFRQSARLQVRLFHLDLTRGFPEREARAMLRDLQSDLARGVLEVTPVDWADAHRIAERLSATHTIAQGYRLVDLLQVATALHLGAADFLTFNDQQRRLAQAEGLETPV